MHAHAIATVRSEWAVRSRSLEAAEVFERLVAAEPVLAAVGAADLRGIFACLERPSRSATRHWEIVAALIRQFRAGEIVGIGLVAALSPALLCVAQRLDWGQGGPWQDADGFAADLVTETWLVLCDMAGETFAYPERAIIDRLRRRLAHQRSRHQAGRRREAPTEDAAIAVSVERADLAPSEPRRATVLDQLAAALAAHDRRSVPREDLRLVFATRVLGYSCGELADKGSGCRRTLEYRRGRAEALLCA